MRKAPAPRLEAAAVSALRGGRRVLDHVSVAARAGEVLVILGPNGAGKSTLLSLLAGLEPPAGGTVRIDGEPIADLPAERLARRRGYLPQGGGIAWNLSARAVVELGRLPHRGRFGGPSAADRAAVDAALLETGTVDLADRPVGALSGGERARVLLARVLAGEPDVLLADEPLQNLDPAHQLRLLERLRAAADRGAAVVLVCHDLALAGRVADRALVLKDGQVAAAGDATAVLTPHVLGPLFGIALTSALVPVALHPSTG